MESNLIFGESNKEKRLLFRLFQLSRTWRNLFSMWLILIGYSENLKKDAEDCFHVTNFDWILIWIKFDFWRREKIAPLVLHICFHFHEHGALLCGLWGQNWKIKFSQTTFWLKNVIGAKLKDDWLKEKPNPGLFVNMYIV